MNRQDTAQRIYNIVSDLRKLGWSYIRIELFWLNCIKTASKETTMLKHLLLELKIIRCQVLLGIEVLSAWYKDNKLKIQ